MIGRGHRPLSCHSRSGEHDLGHTGATGDTVGHTGTPHRCNRGHSGTHRDTTQVRPGTRGDTPTTEFWNTSQRHQLKMKGKLIFPSQSAVLSFTVRETRPATGCANAKHCVLKHKYKSKVQRIPNFSSSQNMSETHIVLFHLTVPSMDLKSVSEWWLIVCDRRTLEVTNTHWSQHLSETRRDCLW